MTISHLLRLAHASLGMTLLALSAIAHAGDPTHEVGRHRTGARLPTAEERMKLTRKPIKQVRPNAVAIARKNAELQRQGRSPIAAEHAQRPENEIEIDRRVRAGAVGGTGEPAAQATAAVSAIPTAVDNSALAAFPPIGDQGNEGSCVGWATAYYLASHELCLARGCNNKTASANVMSPRWVYNMINNGADSGSTLTDAYTLLTRNGVTGIGDVPYVEGEYRKWTTQGAHWRAALNNRMNDVETLTAASTEAGLTNLRQLLANGHVANFLTTIYSYQYTQIAADPSSPSPYAGSPYAGQYVVTQVAGDDGLHVMTIVGYDDTIWTDLNRNGAVDAGERGAFKVANSWGVWWANDGYVWLSYDAIQAVSAVAGGPASATRRSAFYDDAVYTLGARANYQPRLVAEFTLNHLSRNQIYLVAGASDPSGSVPTVYAGTGALLQQGGPYAFDGGTRAVDGNFVLDLTELMPATPSTTKYYLELSDSTTGNPLQLKTLKLIDTANGQETLTSTNLVLSVDGATRYGVMTYNTADGNMAPVARISAIQSHSGNNAQLVLSGLASQDPDGTITSYRWDFGDGSQQATNSTVSHTYAAPGTYTVRLTVTDKLNAIGSATYQHVVRSVDTGAPTAPARLSARMHSMQTSFWPRIVTSFVTLEWPASSDNLGVTGYEIYRNNALLAVTNSTRYLNTLPPRSGVRYSYHVIARDAAGNRSRPSNTVQVSAP